MPADSRLVKMHKTKYPDHKSTSFQNEFDCSYQLSNSIRLSFAIQPTGKAQSVFVYAFRSNTRCAKNVGHRCEFLLKNPKEIRLWISNFLALQSKHAV